MVLPYTHAQNKKNLKQRFEGEDKRAIFGPSTKILDRKEFSQKSIYSTFT